MMGFWKLNMKVELRMFFLSIDNNKNDHDDDVEKIKRTVRNRRWKVNRGRRYKRRYKRNRGKQRRRKKRRWKRRSKDTGEAKE